MKRQFAIAEVALGEVTAVLAVVSVEVATTCHGVPLVRQPLNEFGCKHHEVAPFVLITGGESEVPVARFQKMTVAHSAAPAVPPLVLADEQRQHLAQLIDAERAREERSVWSKPWTRPVTVAG